MAVKPLTPLTPAQAHLAEQVYTQFQRAFHQQANRASRRLPPDSVLDHDDLMQEAAIAALGTARCYREGRGAKLQTYLTATVINRYSKVVKQEWRRRGGAEAHHVSLSDAAAAVESSSGVAPDAVGAPRHHARVLRIEDTLSVPGEQGAIDLALDYMRVEIPDRYSKRRRKAAVPKVSSLV